MCPVNKSLQNPNSSRVNKHYEALYCAIYTCIRANDESRMHYSWALSISAKRENGDEEERKKIAKKNSTEIFDGSLGYATRVRCNRLYGIHVGMYI